MTTRVNGYNTQNQDVARCPEWHIFDVEIDEDAGAALKLADVPENTIHLDSFIDVYQAEAGGTATRVDLQRSDGAAAHQTINTGVADNLGTTGRKAGTVVPEGPMAAGQQLRLLVTKSGTITTPAKARVCVLLMRVDY